MFRSFKKKNLEKMVSTRNYWIIWQTLKKKVYESGKEEARKKMEERRKELDARKKEKTCKRKAKEIATQLAKKARLDHRERMLKKESFLEKMIVCLSTLKVFFCKF